MDLLRAARLAADLSAAALKNSSFPFWDNFENSRIRPEFDFRFHGWKSHEKAGNMRFPYGALGLFALYVSR